MPQSELADPAPYVFETRWSGFSAGGEASVTAGGVHTRCCSPSASDNWHLAALSVSLPLTVHRNQTTPAVQETQLTGVHPHILQHTTAALMLNKGLTGFPVQPAPFDLCFLAQSQLGLLAIGLNLPMSPYCEDTGRVCRSEET